MRAIVLSAPRQMDIRDVPRPVPGPHDVLIDVQSVGLCGTDFHIYSGEGNYNLDAAGQPVPLEQQPLILGHEVTGVVVEPGSAVEFPRPGQRVVIDQGLNCNSRQRAELCEYCASGDSHQCADFEEFGITGLPGGLAEQMAVPAVNTVPIESDLEPALAAMTEPLGCVLHATEAATRSGARYRLNDPDPARRARSLLVCGAGPAGNLFVQVLRKVLGFDGQLFVSEPDPLKRSLAAPHGAECLDPTGEADLASTLRELTSGRMIDYLVDASGSGPLFRAIPGLIRKQATLLLYGHGHGGEGLEVLNQIQWREPTLVSPCGASGPLDADGRPSIYRRALELLEHGRIDVAPLVTHRLLDLDSLPTAFSTTYREPGYVKGIALLSGSGDVGP